jgi:hypothetical protein
LKHSLRKQCLKLLLVCLYRRTKLLHFLVVAFRLLEKVANGKHLPSKLLAAAIAMCEKAYWLSVFVASSSDSASMRLAALCTGD